MRKKDFRLSKLKKQLVQKKENGIKHVVWKINQEQLEYLSGLELFKIEPYLYTVKTRRCKGNYKDLPQLLKYLHQKNKKGVKQVTMYLSPEEVQLLNDYGVSHRVGKYKIILNE